MRKSVLRGLLYKLVSLGVACLLPQISAAVEARAVVHAASFQPTIAPDALASVFGESLAEDLHIAELDEQGELPANLGDVSVSVAGISAGLLFVSPTQINFVTPAETPLGDVTITVSREGVGEAS